MSNLILCGFKSCGKTTLGKKLAKKTGKKFIDTDPENARELYIQNPHVFREIEKKNIAGLIGTENAVIATGAGAILIPENVMVLKKLGKIIYLRIEKSELKRRLSKDIPAYLDKNRFDESFEEMYNARYFIYESIADFIIEKETEIFSLS